MKILKNKTYNDLMLRLQKSESDLKKQIEKTDRVQTELNLANDSFILQRDEIKNQKDFISFLNERVQKAEAEAKRLAEDNRLLFDEADELRTKLSRKGLGKKGLKKENVFIVEQQIDESQITKVEFEEYIDISEVNTLTDYIGYEFIAIDYNGNQTKGIICEDKTGSECIIAFIPTKSLGGWVVNDYDKTIPEKYHNKQFNARYIGVIGVLDWFNSFKIIKK